MQRDEFKQQLWATPAAERCAMLVCSIVQQDTDALRAVFGLVALTSAMAKNMSAEKRFKLSEQMRDAADALEKPAVCVGGE